MSAHHPSPDRSLAAFFQAAGELVECSGNRPFVLQGDDQIWFLATGDLQIFATALREGQPTGARSHFCTVGKGSLLFGFNFEEVIGSSGFLCSGKIGTRLYRLSRYALEKEMAAGKLPVAEVAEALNHWIDTLSGGITKEIVPLPRADHQLEAGQEKTASAKERVRARDEVVWVPANEEVWLFLDMETILPGDDSSHFPISRQAWSGLLQKKTVTPLSTYELLDRGELWPALQSFHENLCRCEFINRRLVMADEYLRLEDKAAHGETARKNAYREIGSVLHPKEIFSPGDPSQTAPPSAPHSDLFEATRLVGQFLALTVKKPADLHQTKHPNPLDLIASASNFRYRKVALKDDWWKGDHGPLLGFLEEGHKPVAILPQKAGKYLLVNPVSGEKIPLTRRLAETLEPFAFTFFRPFPAQKIRARDLLAHGFHRQTGEMVGILGLALVIALIGLTPPFLTGKLFDVVIPSADRGLLLQLFLGVFFAAIGTTLFTRVQEYGILRVTGKVNFHLQSAIWDRLLNLPTPFFRRYNAGDLTDRANAVNEIESVVTDAGVTTLLAGLASALNLLLLFYYSWRLALVAVALVLFTILFCLVINLFQLRNLKEMFALSGRLQGQVFQLIKGISKLRVAGAENHAFAVWAKQFAEQKRIYMKIGRINNTIQTFQATWPLLTSMVIFAFALFFLSRAEAQPDNTSLTTGQFLAFNAAFGIFLGAILQIALASVSLFVVFPLYQRSKPILETIPEIRQDRTHPGELSGRVEIKNLHFRYHPNTPSVLNGLSLDAEPGEFIALVGPSGSGKSTLLRLLLGFEEPENGSIYYDGNELSSLELRALRQQIGVVLQNGQLIAADIFQNIILGKSHLTLKDAWQAARLSGLEKDIRQMPMGMHTIVNEGAGNLSGGQRQRLMIARAIVSKPRMVFFDEATSALDNTTQQIVAKSLEEMQATRIVIAHRLSTIREADKIIVLNQGKVVEQGTYAELMENNGLFTTLAKRQTL